MIAIQGAGHYFHAIRGGESLPSLEGRLRAVCRERFRRVDRLIELALLGSGECAAGKTLAPDCGLYISSGIGPIGSNVVVRDAVSRDGRPPMPFDFVNTLGSSAGYYVGKNLGLTGESTFVSRRRSAFTAALACAVADMSSGVVPQALVGAIEECPLPVARFRELVGLPADAVAAEGSHWLLLAHDGEARPSVAVEEPAANEFAGYESRDAAALASFVLRHPSAQHGLSFTSDGAVRLESF